MLPCMNGGLTIYLNISSSHAPQKEVKYGSTSKGVFSVEKGGKVLDNLRPVLPPLATTP
jgi:hypothetical protein